MTHTCQIHASRSVVRQGALMNASREDGRGLHEDEAC